MIACDDSRIHGIDLLCIYGAGTGNGRYNARI
jgi:hypothetical protein